MTEILSAECSVCNKCVEDNETAKIPPTVDQFIKITKAEEDSICLNVECAVESCSLQEDETTKGSCVATNSIKDDFSGSSSCEVVKRTSKTFDHSLNAHGATAIITINKPQNIDLELSTSKETSTSTREGFSIRSEVTSSGISSEGVCTGLAQFEQLSEEDYESIPTCRICHSDGEAEPLISPCLCTGTVKHVHHSCLMDWLKRCVKTKCELCLQPISVNRKTKPLKQWRRPGQKPTPIIWLLTFIVALTLNIASIAKDGSQKCVSNPCIIFYVVGAVGALLGFAFFYHFLIVSIRYVKQWMALNEDWTLDALSKPSGLGNANLALSDKSLGAKGQTEVQMAEVV